MDVMNFRMLFTHFSLHFFWQVFSSITNMLFYCSFELVSGLHNALLLIRSFCKYFIEVVPPSDTVLHFGGVITHTVDEETGKEVFSCTGIVKFDIPPSPLPLLPLWLQGRSLILSSGMHKYI